MNLSIATFDATHPARAGVIGAGNIRPRTTSWTRRIIVNAVSVCTALSVLVIGVTLLVDSRQPAASPPALPVAAVAQAIAASDAQLQQDAAGDQSQQPNPPVASGNVVERRGADIVIDLSGQSRLQAAQQLATLTGARLMEGSALLAQATPVTLQWRGRDPLEAWRRLFGENIRHVVHCQVDGCRVWVLALNATVTSASPLPKADDDAGSDAAIPSASDEPATAEPAEEQVAPMNTPTPPDE